MDEQGSVPVPQSVQQKPGATFTAAEAKNPTGKKITICDKVFDTRFLENSNGQPTFLNMGAAYPSSLLTVVIFGTEWPNFKEKPEVLTIKKKFAPPVLSKNIMATLK